VAQGRADGGDRPVIDIDAGLLKDKFAQLLPAGKTFMPRPLFGRLSGAISSAAQVQNAWQSLMPSCAT
jgi:hypothetical protein